MEMCMEYMEKYIYGFMETRIVLLLWSKLLMLNFYNIYETDYLYPPGHNAMYFVEILSTDYKVLHLRRQNSS
jgi:hypothetical protein